jgi:hypothetical protein
MAPRGSDWADQMSHAQEEGPPRGGLFLCLLDADWHYRVMLA